MKTAKELLEKNKSYSDRHRRFEKRIEKYKIASQRFKLNAMIYRANMRLETHIVPDFILYDENIQYYKDKGYTINIYPIGSPYGRKYKGFPTNTFLHLGWGDDVEIGND